MRKFEGDSGQFEPVNLTAGRMKVVMDDGEELEYGPGDFAIMRPGMTRGSSARSRAS